MKGLTLGLGLGLLGLGLGFVAGRRGLPVPTAAMQRLAQQTPDDPRELIPLTPGQAPGQGQGQGQPPGASQAPGNCPITFFKDGRFYRMQPGPGNQGQPGGDDELFPLTPLPTPQTPFAPFTPDPSRRT